MASFATVNYISIKDYKDFKFKVKETNNTILY
jgi:hypothetical protein